MFKKTLRYLIVAVGLFTLLSGISCNKDDSTVASEIVIYYKDRTLDIEDDVTSSSVKFTAYTNWYVTIDTAYTDWLSTNAYSGSTGSFVLTIKTTMNDSADSRKGYVIVHGESNYAQITVTQRGYQIITFKDAQFEQYCLDNFDLDQSGYVTSREAHLAKEINCSDKNITDFTGLEYFKNIVNIDISGNAMQTISFAKSTLLTKIRCQNCPTLLGLEVGNNLKELNYMNCSGCYLTSLKIDSCVALNELDCRANDLKSLSIIGNTKLSILDVSENYNMTSLLVSEDHKFARLTKEETTRIVYPSEIITVPDPEFQKYLLEQFDVNRDNMLDAGEAEAVTYIRCHGKIGNPRNIYSLEGLEFFPNITTLDCSYCMISDLNLLYNPKLELIYCHNNSNLSKISISSLSPLTKFNCADCGSLTTLDLNRNTYLTELHAENCNLSDIDLTDCVSLKDLFVSHNKLSTLTTTDNKLLNYVDCSYNNISGTLTIQGCDSLAFLFCNNNLIEDFDIDIEDIYDIDCGNNKLAGELNLADWKYLHTFACDSNSITAVKLPDSFIMTKLDVKCNELTELDLSVQPYIQYVDASDNKIATIKTTGCDYLERLNLRSNSFAGEVSFSTNRGLKVLWIDQNPDLETLYIPKSLLQFEYKVDEGVQVVEK